MARCRAAPKLRFDARSLLGLHRLIEREGGNATRISRVARHQSPTHEPIAGGQRTTARPGYLGCRSSSTISGHVRAKLRTALYGDFSALACAPLSRLGRPPLLLPGP
jgi:hypothetical protein